MKFRKETTNQVTTNWVKMSIGTFEKRRISRLSILYDTNTITIVQTVYVNLLTMCKHNGLQSYEFIKLVFGVRSTLQLNTRWLPVSRIKFT